jgi:hypothetical protein
MAIGFLVPECPQVPNGSAPVNAKRRPGRPAADGADIYVRRSQQYAQRLKRVGQGESHVERSIEAAASPLWA